MIRFAMMPLTFAFAFLVVWAVLYLVALGRDQTVLTLLRSDPDGHWLLIVMLPALFLGFPLALIFLNCVGYLVFPIRRAFDRECHETGRPGFGRANAVLAKVAAIISIVTLIGSVIFLRCAP